MDYRRNYIQSQWRFILTPMSELPGEHILLHTFSRSHSLLKSIIHRGDSRYEMAYFLVCASLLIILTHILLIKIFKIEANSFISKQKNSSHTWLEGILFGLLVPCTVFSLIIQAFPIYYILIIFLIALFSLRSYMEWKYDRSSKQYILDLHGLFVLITLFIVLKFTR
jgi:hypothetical protein